MTTQRVTHEDLQKTVDKLQKPAEKLRSALRVPGMWYCTQCGYGPLTKAKVDATVVCVLPPCRIGHPDNQYPGEYETECPECRQHESFEEEAE